MSRLTLAASGAIVPGMSLAQVPDVAVSHAIVGVVYDSVAGVPLAGAVVQVVFADSTGPIVTVTGRHKIFSAVADSIGRFSVTGMPAGRFAIGFQHDALNALGMESPVIAVTLGRDTVVRVDLAIPSAKSMSGRLCAVDAHRIGDALLAGYAIDARDGAPITNGSITARWVELEPRRGKLRSVPHRVTASLHDRGVYRACGVPADAPVEVQVEAVHFHPIDFELTLPDGNGARHDFRLVDSAASRGSATITMRVVDDSGVAVESGRVSIPELGRDGQVKDGAAVMPDLPPGTWALTLRAFGFQPQSILLDAVAETSAPVTITMMRGATTLDTMRVVGKSRVDEAVLRAIDNRMLIADGTKILADNLAVVNSIEASDAIRVATGFSWKSSTVVEGRTVGGPGGPCVSDTTATPRPVRGKNATLSPYKHVVFYVDGSRVPGGLEIVNRMVPPKDILAIEAYPDVMSAPFLWRTNDACAVVAFWTKHRPR